MTMRNVLLVLLLTVGVTACGGDPGSDGDGIGTVSPSAAADTLEAEGSSDAGEELPAEASTASGQALLDDALDDRDPVLVGRVDCSGEGLACSHEFGFSATTIDTPAAFAVYPGDDHCSPATFDVFIDGDQVGSAYFHHEDKVGSALIRLEEPGEFDVAVQATGYRAGCNTGDLLSWGIEVRSNGVEMDDASAGPRPVDANG